MSTSFPTSLDVLTNPTSTDPLSSPSHSTQHINSNDAIEAIEAKVGVDSSAVTTSHDYKLSGVTGSDKAVSLTGIETLTNKRLTTPKLNEDVAITATATEVNYNDVAAPGTAEATKALITDANKDINLGTGDITATILTIAAMAGTWDGWVAVTETWTYASADSPTFTFTIAGDQTAKYKRDMKIMITQTTDKYFIISKDSTYSAPNTTITVFGGTDYTLTSAAITNPKYSVVKAPAGFPSDFTKWSLTLISDSANNVDAAYTTATWQNGSESGLSGSAHIGIWEVAYNVITTGTRVATATSIQVPPTSITLSSANNTESNSALTVHAGGVTLAGFSSASYTGINILGVSTRALGILTLTSKTTEYLNIYSSQSGTLTNFGFRGDLMPTTVKLIYANL